MRVYQRNFVWLFKSLDKTERYNMFIRTIAGGNLVIDYENGRVLNVQFNSECSTAEAAATVQLSCD